MYLEIFAYIGLVLFGISLLNLFFYSHNGQNPVFKVEFLNKFAQSKAHIILGELGVVAMIVHGGLAISKGMPHISGIIAIIAAFAVIGSVHIKRYAFKGFNNFKIHVTLAIIAAVAILAHWLLY